MGPDDGVDPGVLAAAETAVSTLPGVGHVHVRARWVGRSLLVDVEGFVPGGTTVEATEALGLQVEQAVMRAVPESRAVLWSPRSLPRASSHRAHPRLDESGEEPDGTRPRHHP